MLSGDDALALPIIALGGRGVISVASNEIPAEMTQLVQLCLHGDFAAARALQRKYLPLMEVNFVESNPIPVKAAMAAMGLLEPVWRLPLCAPKAAKRGKNSRRAGIPGSAGGQACCRSKLRRSSTSHRQVIRRRARAPVSEFKDALNAGTVRAAEPDRELAGRLAREWLGEERHPARISHGRHRGYVHRPGAAAVLRQGHLPGEAIPLPSGVRIVPGGSSIRDGCYLGQRRHLHAADVHQCGRLRGRSTPWWIPTPWWAAARRSARAATFPRRRRLGGVLEPVGAMPVIIEDDVIVGGNCGVYEGTIVKRGAVLGTRHDPESLDAGLRSGDAAKFTARPAISRW